jgi:alanine-synthesizing transaminase
MKSEASIKASDGLKNVRYEIRGALSRRAIELERQGYEIISLNIGNPGAYGFRTPEILRLALVQNLSQAEGYCYQKGIYPAREAILLQQESRGIRGGTTESVFIGNGTSELIDMTLRALLSDGDEVLVPAPDYPLWTAAVTLNGGRPVHYSCRPENRFMPDPAEVEGLITPRTRALVVINPNNPTGAVYPREVLEGLARVAEKHGLMVLSDEIYDGITYDGVPFVPIASLVNETLCATLSGLSKVYRAAGYRVG